MLAPGSSASAGGGSLLLSSKISGQVKPSSHSSLVRRRPEPFGTHH